MLPGLITVIAVLLSGSGANGATVVGSPTGDVVVGEEAAFEDLDGVGFGLVDGAAVTLTELAAIGRSVIGGLVAACAVAVNETEDAPLEGAVTAACIVNVEGAVEVASGPSSQPAPPSPLGHDAVNTPRAPDGPAERLTHADGVGPYGAHTFTVNDATWPPSTLDCARVTLTHSAGVVADAADMADELSEEADAEPEDAEPADEDAEEDADADGDGEGDADAVATGKYWHCAPGGSAKDSTDARATLPPGKATTAKMTPAVVATAFSGVITRPLRVRAAHVARRSVRRRA
jgi:hypothetical protein